MTAAPFHRRPSRLRTAGATPAVVLALLAASVVAEVPAPRAEEWPRLLGPRGDGRTAQRIARQWDAVGPPVLWRRAIGAGFAGLAAAADRVMLFHRVGDEEVLEALSPEGDTVWSSSYPTAYRDDFGFDEGPRATPTIADGRVFTIGAEGALHAHDLDTGERLWSIDTRTRFGAPKGFFGVASSPLVVSGRVLLNVGGAGATGIVAFDAASGEVVWSATEDDASYSSPVVARLGGREVALFFTREGLVEIEPSTGDVRATFRWRSRSNASVNAASPLVVDGRVFLSASYGTGAVLLERDAAGFAPTWTAEDALNNHYATSIHHAGYLYGFHGALHLGPPDLRARRERVADLAWRCAGALHGSISGWQWLPRKYDEATGIAIEQRAARS